MHGVARFLLYTITFLFVTHICRGNAGIVHYTVKDGLLNSTVYFAMQDSKGFLWLCTETGVNRFDGRNFESYTIQNGLADNEIFRCFEDATGKIWFLSYNGKLSYYQSGKICNSKNTPALAYPANSGFLINCLPDDDGNTWFTTSSGDVLKVTSKSVTQIKSPFPQRHHNANFITANLFKQGKDVFKFSVDNTNNLYKFYLNSSEIERLGTIDSLLLRPSYISGIDQVFDEDAFINQNTVIRYDIDHNRFASFNKDLYGIHAKILCLYKADDALWLGTAGEGIYKVNLATRKPVERILKDEVITSILKDNEGNVWTTTHGTGAYCIKKQSESIAMLSNKAANTVNVVGRESGEIIVAGGNKSDIVLFENGHLKKEIFLNDIDFNRIHDIVDIGDGNAIIGSDIPATYIYNVNTSHTKQIPVGYKSSCVSRAGEKWFCSSDIIYKWEGNNLVAKHNIASGNKATSIAVINDTLMYVGTTNRLLQLSGSNMNTQEVLNSELLQTGVTGLLNVQETLWVATHGNGVFILQDNKVVKHITVKEAGIASDIIQRIYDDNKQYIWLSTNKGLSVIDRNKATLVSSITSNNGLSSDDVKSVMVSGQDAYIATASGVDVLDLKDMNPFVSPPKVYFTKVSFNDSTIADPVNSVSIEYFKGSVNIHFTAISFTVPQQIQYAYKFAGEKNWQYTSIPRITFFDLSPGHHTLLVKAKRYNSAYSSPISLAVFIKPLWYQTTLFYGMVILAAIGIMILIFRKRIQWIREREKQKNLVRQQIINLESKSLAYQMNPHFIFNSLNTVQHYILTKSEHEAMDYLSDFSLLMRQILENSKKSYVSLKEELDFLERYLYLEKIRYADKFDYRIDIIDTLQPDQINIPPILIQPLIENAIKHGISGYNDGLIIINISKADGFLLVSVKDNGRGMSGNEKNREPNKESTAIKVLEERLKLMGNSNSTKGTISVHVADIESIERPGTLIEMHIPIKY